jgi:salicylate hydroxylase
VRAREEAKKLRRRFIGHVVDPDGDSVSRAGLRILDRLLDIESINRIAFRGDQDGGYVYRHWKTGEIVNIITNSPGIPQHLSQARTYRIPLYKTLWSNVPREWIQCGKRVTSVQARKDGISLSFEDGSAVDADMVVAADGINSVQ